MTVLSIDFSPGSDEIGTKNVQIMVMLHTFSIDGLDINDTQIKITH